MKGFRGDPGALFCGLDLGLIFEGEVDQASYRLRPRGLVGLRCGPSLGRFQNGKRKPHDGSWCGFGPPALFRNRNILIVHGFSVTRMRAERKRQLPIGSNQLHGVSHATG